MKRKPIQYDFYIHSVSGDGSPAYEAIIPAFDNAIVFGDNLKELEEGIAFAIDSEIAERKAQKKPIPAPEKKTKFSGKILVRITPLLHEQIALAAKASGESLNKHIESRLISG